MRGPGSQAGRGAVPAVDFVGEHELQEVGVAQRVLSGQAEPLGQGVEAAAELQSTQQRSQLG